MIPERLKRVSEDPLSWARDRKAMGRRVIGYFLPDVPVEIIHAAGADPFLLTGASWAASEVSARLQDYACPISRRGLGLALSHEIDFLDGVVLPIVCDTTRCMAHIWRNNCERPFLHSLLLPRKRDDLEARNYLLREFSRLRERLEESLGAAISLDSLRQSIALYNRQRQAMKEIYLLRQGGRLGLCNGEFQDLVRSSFIIPPEEHNPSIEGLRPRLLEMEARAGDGSIRIYISGKVAEPRELFAFLDELGCTIVGDDLWDGYCSFSSHVREWGDPMEGLRDHYMDRLPSPVFFDSRGRRELMVAETAQSLCADAVVFLHPRCCEVFAFHYPTLKLTLQSVNIPHLLLELESGPGLTVGLRKQLESFVEVLRSHMAG